MQLIKNNRYPGDSEYYIICAICGKKMRAKEGRLAESEYQKNLVVCQDDYDIYNPQFHLRSVVERKPPPAIWNRGENTNDTFVVNSDTDRVPGPPRELSFISLTDTFSEIQWLGPYDSGSGAISGYKIEIARPIGGTYETVVENTGSVAMYYKHIVASGIGVETCYRVSAINDFGTGNPSVEVCYDRDASILLFTTEDGADYITTEDDDFITEE
tara:strand:- start:82 stop:723 length:642 start_codon:yes stop_codon:yes gene_type:complete